MFEETARCQISEVIIHKNEVMFARLERTNRSFSPAGRRCIKSFIYQEIPDYAQCALIAINNQYPVLPLSPHNLSPCPDRQSSAGAIWEESSSLFMEEMGRKL
jgi:hypothetical protein